MKNILFIKNNIIKWCPCFFKSTLFLLFLTVFVSSINGSLGEKKVQTIIDGESAKKIGVYRFSEDDYFSINEIADLYGSQLSWHPVTGKVAMMKNNRRLDIFIKSTRIYIDGKKKRISIPTRFVEGQLYVPACFVLSSSFSNFTETKSIWDSDTKILTIDHKINIAAPRFYSRAGATRIEFELLDKLSCNFVMKDKKTISISFPRGCLSEDKINVDDGLVNSIELKNKGRLAVVNIRLANSGLQVKKTQSVKPERLIVSIVENAAGSDDKFVEVDVLEKKGFEVAVSSDIESVSETPLADVPEEIIRLPAIVETPKREEKKKRLVVLDAGHGGKDPGALGRNGTKEKDINLQIVNELKRLFDENKDCPFDVILTRKDDTFIPLVDRTSLANEKKADLFVSIHCNSHPKKDTSGFEIYFLSEKATDDDAAATALLENSVVQLEGKPEKKQARLQNVLWSLIVNEFINESSELCSFISGEITRRVKVENRGVKQAGFYVLRGAEMPAILVECAFLSNYAEESKLKTTRFRSGIVDAIYEGIAKYDTRRDMLNAKR